MVGGYSQEKQRYVCMVISLFDENLHEHSSNDVSAVVTLPSTIFTFVCFSSCSRTNLAAYGVNNHEYCASADASMLKADILDMHSNAMLSHSICKHATTV